MGFLPLLDFLLLQAILLILFIFHPSLSHKHLCMIYWNVSDVIRNFMFNLSPFGSRPSPLPPFAERSEPRGFPKQPSVRGKSKGQNPELWPAGPALLRALWRPAGP